MFALVSPEKIQLPAGAVVRLPATWQEYQILCQQRGDNSKGKAFQTVIGVQVLN